MIERQGQQNDFSEQIDGKHSLCSIRAWRGYGICLHRLNLEHSKQPFKFRTHPNAACIVNWRRRIGVANLVLAFSELQLAFHLSIF
jgi:hypothetical protein